MELHTDKVILLNKVEEAAAVEHYDIAKIRKDEGRKTLKRIVEKGSGS